MSALASVTPAHQRLQSALQACLGPDLAVVCTGVDGQPDALWPDERAAMASAIPRRQREFAAGRAAARAAMRRLGWPECAIPPRQDRSPAWPDGWVGSISHSASVCLAVGAWRQRWASIGIDIEEDQRVGPELWPLVCRPRELRSLEALDAPAQKHRVTRLFSAKEAFYKWQYPQTRRMLDFQDVEIRLRPDGSGFEVLGATAPDAPEGPVLATGRQLPLEGHVFSCVAQRAPIQPAVGELS